jgi:hypothetical protein
LRWSHRAGHFEPDKDFIYEPDRANGVFDGCRLPAGAALAQAGLLDTIDTERIYTHVEQAITAELRSRLTGTT